MNILVAPNAFKNSITADAAAEAISKGLLASRLDCKCTSFPIADGGDGTASLLLKQLGGEIIQETVHDPIGRKITASFGLTDNNQTAIIEMADASGLRLLKKQEYDPLHTSTFGTGELIIAALEKNVQKIILCIGGSATVDAGMGIMQALGMKLYDKKGNILKQGPTSFNDLAAIDDSGIDKKVYDTSFIILCDVENTLLGPEGSATVFGPQKGASPLTVNQLEANLTKLRDLVLEKTGKDMAIVKHGGAAGGIAAGLHTFLNATLVNGIEFFLDITGFNNVLPLTDLVITGEGSIDEQTLNGKGPFGVAKRAKERSIPVIGMAGKIPLDGDKRLQQYFDILIPINHELTDIETVIKYTGANLFRSAKLLGDLLSLQTKNSNRNR